ncbi:MAG: TauD/TfdA family dioxygenase, partial [Betaproteobacteria bacterium]
MATFAPLSEGFGLETRDVDLAQLDDATFATVERAFYRGQVLAIRGQKLAPQAFVAFARRFG